MSQTQIVYHKLLVYCALILLSLFQQIIGRKDALLIQGLYRFQADNMKTSL